MKLNLLKCAFRVAFGKFLDFMVNHRGIEANLEKIQVLIDMWSPCKTMKVPSLTGRVAALSRFISRATSKCLLFFDSLKGSKIFFWDDKYKQVFRSLKVYLTKTDAALEACRRRMTISIPCSHGVRDLRGPCEGRKKSPIAGVLHQQVTCRCRNEISRDREVSPGPCDRYEKIETVLPFTPNLGPHK